DDQPISPSAPEPARGRWKRSLASAIAAIATILAGGIWFGHKMGSGTVVPSTLRAVPATGSKRGQAPLCQAPCGPFRQRSQTPFWARFQTVLRDLKVWRKSDERPGTPTGIWPDCAEPKAPTKIVRKC